jgi:hypothetical protein
MSWPGRIARGSCHHRARMQPEPAVKQALKQKHSQAVDLPKKPTAGGAR